MWNDKLWTSVEQAFQYRKAEVFGDQYAMDLIRNTADCKQQKRITRNLENFDQKLWDKMRESVMISICREKVKTNFKYLKSKLSENLFLKKYATLKFLSFNKLSRLEGC